MSQRQLDAAADRMLGQLRRQEFQPELCEECGKAPTAPRSCYCTACELAIYGEPECDGHPAGPFDPMGETVYCDGSCRR